MSNWITICEFPLQKDLSPVAAFIRHHQLPIRISEENNRQRVASLVPQLVEPIGQLLAGWQAGEVDLSRVTVQLQDAGAPAGQDGIDSEGRGNEHGVDGLPPETTVSEKSDVGEHKAEQPRASVIPNWPLKQTPLCIALIALCFIGWFLLRQGWAEALVIFPQQAGDFDVSRSSLSWHLSRGEYWRLWTPAIVHFSLPHALFNGLGVWIIGRSLEARAGTLAFALLVLVSAPVANLAQYLWAPQSLFGGMSGVVYALVGAAFVIQRWQPRWKDVPASIIWLAVIWLLVCMSGVVNYFISGGIANAAHLGGFAAGLILGLVFCVAGGARRFSPGGSAMRKDTASTIKKF